MSGSFESVRWNACVHRLHLGLYTHPKEFWGNGVRTHVYSKRKIPFIGGSEEGGTRDAASRRTGSPTHYRVNYSGPALVSTPRIGAACGFYGVLFPILASLPSPCVPALLVMLVHSPAYFQEILSERHR